MATVEGAKNLKAKLQRLKREADAANISCVVGYTAHYALAVHESRDMKLRGLPRRGKRAKGFYWDPQGRAQAQFLLGPYRRLTKTLGAIVTEALRLKKTMAQALMLAGLRLQRESQLVVPVDTGNLKNSAFTRLEKRDA